MNGLINMLLYVLNDMMNGLTSMLVEPDIEWFN